MDDFQLTSDPEKIAHVTKLRAELGDGQSTTVEMHSGITYSGAVSGMRYRTDSRSGKPPRLGCCIVIDTVDGKVRLDALDIKSWSNTRQGHSSPVAVIKRPT